jgi:hypothetical protein
MTPKTTKRGYKLPQYIIIGAIVGAFWLIGSPFASAENYLVGANISPVGYADLSNYPLTEVANSTNWRIFSGADLSHIGSLIDGNTGGDISWTFTYWLNTFIVPHDAPVLDMEHYAGYSGDGTYIFYWDTSGIDHTGTILSGSSFFSVFTRSGGVWTSAYINTLSNPDTNYTVWYSGTPTGGITYETCSVGDLFCYMRNALTWAFTPPAGTFDNWVSLKETLRTKAPFGYVSSVFDTLNGINNTTTPAFTLESVAPINDLVFSPIRTALEWILYFAFAFMLFKRFKDINI